MLSILDRHCVYTPTGTVLDLDSPDFSSITKEDIAIGLTTTRRFASLTTIPIYVSAHSVVVAQTVREAQSKANPYGDFTDGEIQIQLTALLHDASEAFLGDIPRALKRLLPDYQYLEHQFQEGLAKRFGTIYPIPDEVKVADNLVGDTEFARWHLHKNNYPKKLPDFSSTDEDLFEVYRDSMTGSGQRFMSVWEFLEDAL